MHIGGMHWYATVCRSSRKKLNGRSNLESLWSRTKGKVRHGHDITGRINHPSGRPVAFKQLLSAVLDALSRPVLFSPSILLLSQSLTDWRLTDRRLLKLVSHDRPLSHAFRLTVSVVVDSRCTRGNFMQYRFVMVADELFLDATWSMTGCPCWHAISYSRRIVLSTKFHLIAMFFFEDTYLSWLTSLFEI